MQCLQLRGTCGACTPRVSAGKACCPLLQSSCRIARPQALFRVALRVGVRAHAAIRQQGCKGSGFALCTPGELRHPRCVCYGLKCAQPTSVGLKWEFSILTPVPRIWQRSPLPFIFPRKRSSPGVCCRRYLPCLEATSPLIASRYLQLDPLFPSR